MAAINYEIIENLLTLDEFYDTAGEPYHVEVNIMKWYGGDPKIDIRSWNKDKSKMKKGATLTDEEWEALKNNIKEDI